MPVCHRADMKLFIATTALLLAYCAAQESTPTPPNRQLPFLDPALGIVSGVEVPPAPAPDTTPVFKPRPIPPNRKKPVITKADIVMAMSDKLGILVDSLAKRLAADVENVLTSPDSQESTQDPAPDSGKLSLKPSMDGQMSVRRLIEESGDQDP